jgi:glycogen(starch) synthase
MGHRVLMIGWELPPFNSGGLGEACLGLAHALADNGEHITFVLPKKVDVHFDFMDVVFANVEDDDFKLVNSYDTLRAWLKKKGFEEDFPANFLSGTLRYAQKMRSIALKYSPDVIHAHDWLTIPAALVAKKVTGKPLVLHIHSTEYDRTGGNFPNPAVYKIEKEGVQKADQIISISNMQKNILVNTYGADPNKINVVYNGASTFDKKELPPALEYFKKLDYKIVLYLGRITLMKGPEYFVRAAKRVLEYDAKVIFVVTGSGDMMEAMITEAVSLGIIDKFIFTGFLRGDDKNRIFQSADLYVMPSVSEPFGITPLESIANGTPVLISKQSGISEILNNALKVDFWDTEEMANKILAVVKYPPLERDLKWESGKELPNINWGKSANKVSGLYQQLTRSE